MYTHKNSQHRFSDSQKISQMNIYSTIKSCHDFGTQMLDLHEV